MGKKIKSKLVNHTFSQNELVQLLALGTAVTQAKSTVSLLSLIREKIMGLIPFHDTGILIVEKGGLHHYDMAVNFPGWDDSQANQKLQQGGAFFKVSHPGSYVEHVMQKMEEDKGPIMVDWELVVKQWEHPFFSILTEIGYKESMATLLSLGGRAYGTLLLNSLARNHFANELFPLFMAVAEQVGAAVANIIAKEEILGENRTKAILLRISEHIAAINNRKELFAIIINEIRPIIPIDDTGIIILNKEGTMWCDWSNIDNYQETQAADNLRQAGFTEYIEIDRLMALSFTQTGILSIDDYLKENHPFAPIMAKADLKEFMFTPLVSHGKTIGSLFFDSEKYSTYSPAYFDTFRSIANMVASAVSNILANEEIQEREREKTILLSISEAVATIRDKKELLKFVFEKVKPLFGFYDAGFFVFSRDKEFIEDWTVAMPETSPSAVNYKIAADHASSYSFPASCLEVFYKQLKESKGPAIAYYNEELFARFPEYPQWKPIREIGYKESIGTLLRAVDGDLGILFFNSLTENHFNDAQFTLFQGIADQLATAVTNILANEEILEREKEKTRLLKISEAIASIQNYKELLKVIYELIQPVFPFDNTGLFIFDPLNEQLNEITHGDVLSGTIAESFAEAKVLGPFALKDFKKPSWYFSAIPVITTLSKEVKLINDVTCKQQMNISIKAGLQQMICGPLLTGGKKIGAIYLSTKDAGLYNETHIHLFKSVTNLIAIAVANILANQEIVEREREKSLLLEINDAVVLIKDKADLFHLMMQKLQPFAGFDDAVLVMLSKDGNHCNGMIEAAEIIGPGYAEFNGLIPVSTPIKNSPAGFLRKQPDLYIWSLEEMETLYPNHPYLGMMRQKELRYSVYLKVNWDVNNQVGFLNFHFREKEKIQTKYFKLYKSIAYQLATSLSNILAQGEIEKKAKEIEKLNKLLAAQNTYLVEEVEQQYNFEEMIGQNPKFAEVCRNIGLVAKTDSTVLILGETGTGKELVARAIHNNSTRKKKPLIKLNCAALPASLIESELFGHERGAFTGAIDRRIGKFELANGSTLFLDEVGELPLELQSKLLRALQEKEIERLGSNKTLQIDVRIIAATNRDLGKEVQAGRFRQDLYYRLHIFPLALPALRDRKEDVPLLAAHFLGRYAKKIGKSVQGFGSKAMQDMMGYDWPGNIRELEHVVERCVILCNTRLIQDLNLPDVSKRKITASANEFVIKTWEEQERDYILEILGITKGNVAGKGGAAELLHLSPTTLQSKMEKLGIKRKHFVIGKTGN